MYLMCTEFVMCGIVFFLQLERKGIPYNVAYNSENKVLKFLYLLFGTIS